MTIQGSTGVDAEQIQEKNAAVTENKDMLRCKVSFSSHQNGTYLNAERDITDKDL